MLPDADDLPEILLDLAVPHEDINELIALRRPLTHDSGVMRLLEECVEGLVRDMGGDRRCGALARRTDRGTTHRADGQADGQAGG